MTQHIDELIVMLRQKGLRLSLASSSQSDMTEQIPQASGGSCDHVLREMSKRNIEYVRVEICMSSKG